MKTSGEKLQKKKSKLQQKTKTKAMSLTLKEKLKKFTQARAASAELSRSELAVPLSGQLDLSFQPAAALMSKEDRAVSAQIPLEGGTQQDAYAEGSGDESEQSSAANSTFESPLQIGMEGGVVPSLFVPFFSTAASGAPSPSVQLHQHQQLLSSALKVLEAPHHAQNLNQGVVPSLMEQLEHPQHQSNHQIASQNNSTRQNVSEQLAAVMLSQQKLATVMALHLFKAAESNLLKSHKINDNSSR